MPRAFPFVIASLSLTVLAACDSAAEKQADATEQRIEQQADSSAATSGATPAALGLTETQLLEADLKGTDGTDLGDVEQVRRNASGIVDGLLVELEDSNPSRYVLVPIEGLSPRVDGDDTDLQTTKTKAELAAMPDAIL